MTFSLFSIMQLVFKKIFLVFFLTVLFSAQAQEKIYNLDYNPILQKAALLNSETNSKPHAQKRSTVNLPFFDDFSNKGIYPDASLWTDSFAFINDDLQDNAISYGVATLDGFNAQGLAYNTTTPNAFGNLDTLTSQPINLSGISTDDTTLFLSFFYQPMGKGDWPNEEDSLLLEFKTLNDNWLTVWAVPGFSQRPEATFTQVLIQLNDPFYFVSDFQFRFRNLGTSGNNDHWHIDYVVLDVNRDINDTIRGDISVIGKPSRILKNYRSMPWRQFVDHQEDELEENFKIFYRNNFNTDRNMQFIYSVEEKFFQTAIDNFSLSLSPFTSFSNFFQEYPTSNFAPLTFAPPNEEDSVLIVVKQFLTEIPSSPSFISNDTSALEVPFFNYLAYDDGTAEKGYGLEGPGLKKFAYEFHLNKPDSLQAIQIHFTHINRDASNLLFSLFIWKSINFSTGEEDTLYQKDFLKPLRVDTINGFASYVLDSALYLDAGSFFIGWQQTDLQNAQIGLDIQNSARSKIHIFANGSWITSAVEAAPMIRPVLGKKVNFLFTSIAEKNKNENSFVLFPNPAKNMLNLKFAEPLNEPVYLQIFDLSGHTIHSQIQIYENNSISIGHLPSGTYFITAKSNSLYIKPQRFVKW